MKIDLMNNHITNIQIPSLSYNNFSHRVHHLEEKLEE